MKTTQDEEHHDFSDLAFVQSTASPRLVFLAHDIGGFVVKQVQHDAFPLCVSAARFLMGLLGSSPRKLRVLFQVDRHGNRCSSEISDLIYSRLLLTWIGLLAILWNSSHCP
jgi:hypothetical protein